MGNRAVITTKDQHIGIYLHWNGGRDSVTPFLAYANMVGAPSPEQDGYGWSTLVQVIKNTLGGSVDINTCENLDCDNGDNGMYIIEDWKIVGREYHSPEWEQREYDFTEFMQAINKSMPHPVDEPELMKWIGEHKAEYEY